MFQVDIMRGATTKRLRVSSLEYVVPCPFCVHGELTPKLVMMCVRCRAEVVAVREEPDCENCNE